MAVGNADPQPSPSPTAPAFARQIGGSPGFINEDKLSGIEIELRPKPFLALRQDVGALLLRSVRGFFLNVMSCRSKKRQSTEDEKRSPKLATRRSSISNSVMSG
jgi:hypothetical protein